MVVVGESVSSSALHSLAAVDEMRKRYLNEKKKGIARKKCDTI